MNPGHYVCGTLGSSVVNRGAQRLASKLSGKNAPTQAELAQKLKIDQGYISRIVNGKKVPGLDARKKFRAHLRIPLHWWDEDIGEGAAA